MNGKKITFNGDLDSFKTKDKGVTIQIKTTTDNLSLDKLNDIADGQITVYFESSQLELIEELDSESKDDNDNDGIDLFGINPETKKVEQVSE